MAATARRRSSCPTSRAACRSIPAQGPGGTRPISSARRAGVESVTLTTQQMPIHNHRDARLEQHRPTQPNPHNNVIWQSTHGARSTSPTRRNDADGGAARSRRSAAASRTKICSPICASTSSFRCSGSSRPRPRSRAMADPFVAEIRIFAVQFRPHGLGDVRRPAAADLAEHRAVLAARHHLWRRRQVDLRAARHAGQRADACRARARAFATMSSGRRAARESVTLLESEMPVHTHTHGVDRSRATSSNRRRRTSIARPSGATLFVPARRTPTLVQMAFQALTPAGGSLPHNNMMPYPDAQLHHRVAGRVPAARVASAGLAAATPVAKSAALPAA